MVNWNPLPNVGLTGSLVGELRGKNTGDQVRGLRSIDAEAGNGAQRIARAVPDEKPNITMLERPEEPEDTPVPDGEDHPVPPGIIVPRRPLV